MFENFSTNEKRIEKQNQTNRDLHARIMFPRLTLVTNIVRRAHFSFGQHRERDLLLGAPF